MPNCVNHVIGMKCKLSLDKHTFNFKNLDDLTFRTFSAHIFCSSNRPKFFCVLRLKAQQKTTPIDKTELQPDA